MPNDIHFSKVIEMNKNEIKELQRKLDMAQKMRANDGNRVGELVAAASETLPTPGEGEDSLTWWQRAEPAFKQNMMRQIAGETRDVAPIVLADFRAKRPDDYLNCAETAERQLAADSFAPESEQTTIAGDIRRSISKRISWKFDVVDDRIEIDIYCSGRAGRAVYRRMTFLLVIGDLKDDDQALCVELKMGASGEVRVPGGLAYTAENLARLRHLHLFTDDEVEP